MPQNMLNIMPLSEVTVFGILDESGELAPIKSDEVKQALEKANQDAAASEWKERKVDRRKSQENTWLELGHYIELNSITDRRIYQQRLIVSKQERDILLSPFGHDLSCNTNEEKCDAIMRILSDRLMYSEPDKMMRKLVLEVLNDQK